MDDIVSSDIPLGKHYVYTLSYPESMGGRVFYVGKGQRSRIHEHERQARNGIQSHKCHIIRKIWAHGEQVVKKKIAYFDTHEEACMLEIALIFFMDGLVNLTEGGDGTVGLSIHPTLETRQKLSKAQESPRAIEARRILHASHKGRKRPEGTGLKISAARKEHTVSEETRNKLSIARKGRKRSPEDVQKTAVANRGKKRSEEACHNLSKGRKGKGTGKIPWNKGKLMSEKQRAKLKKRAEEKQATTTRTLIPITWPLGPQIQLKCEDINQLSLWSDA